MTEHPLMASNRTALPGSGWCQNFPGVLGIPCFVQKGPWCHDL